MATMAVRNETLISGTGEKSAVVEKIEDFIGTLGNLFSLYFGPMNLDLLEPDFRNKLSVSERSGLGATLSGIPPA